MLEGIGTAAAHSPAMGCPDAGLGYFIIARERPEFEGTRESGGPRARGPGPGGGLEAGATWALFRSKVGFGDDEVVEEPAMLVANGRRNVDWALSQPGSARLSDDNEGRCSRPLLSEEPTGVEMNCWLLGPTNVVVGMRIPARWAGLGERLALWAGPLVWKLGHYLSPARTSAPPLRQE